MNQIENSQDNENLSSIVTNEQLSYIPILVLIGVLVCTLLLFEFLIRNNESWTKLSYWFLIPFPFILMVILLVIFVATEVDIFIIFLAAGIPFVITMGFSFIVTRKKMKMKFDKNRAKLDSYYSRKKT